MAVELITDEELMAHHGCVRDVLIDILRARGYSPMKAFMVERQVQQRTWRVEVMDKDDVPPDANILMYL